jgi:hypothetical protein
LRKVQLARSCAMGGEDVVKEVEGVESRAGVIAFLIVGKLYSVTALLKIFEFSSLLPLLLLRENAIAGRERDVY